jgi:hypothetical protein
VLGVWGALARLAAVIDWLVELMPACQARA